LAEYLATPRFNAPKGKVVFGMSTFSVIFEMLSRIDPFSKSASEKRPSLEDKILETGDSVNPNAQMDLHPGSDYDYPSSFLGLAIFHRLPRVVKWLLKRGAKPNKKDPNLHDPGFPLQIAADLGYEEIVRILIDGGAKVDISGPNNRTPLHFVFEPWFKCSPSTRNLKVAEFLLDARADIIDVADSLGQTPLHKAVYYAFFEGVEFLVKRGANVDLGDLDYATPLLMAKYLHPDSPSILKLLECTSKQTKPDKELLFLCSTNHFFDDQEWPKLVQKVIDKGANINRQTSRKRISPLHLVAQYDSYGVILAVLLSNGPDLNLKNGKGQTPIDVAYANKALKNAKMLSNAGARANPESKLIAGLKEGNWDDIRNALDEGANVNTRDEDGCTVLHHVCRENNLDWVKWLLDSGAKINVKDKEGNTALMYATGANSGMLMESMEIRSRGSLVRFLLEHGADRSIKDRDGNTAASKCELNLSFLKKIIDEFPIVPPIPKKNSSDSSGFLEKILNLFKLDF
jgi:ankyrin repeat protein